MSDSDRPTDSDELKPAMTDTPEMRVLKLIGLDVKMMRKELRIITGRSKEHDERLEHLEDHIAGHSYTNGTGL